MILSAKLEQSEMCAGSDANKQTKKQVVVRYVGQAYGIELPVVVVCSE